MRRLVVVSVAAALGLAAPAAGDETPTWGPRAVVTQIPGGNLQFLAIADFNGDGHQDVLVTRSVFQNAHSFPVIVLVGDGAGHFVDETSSVFSGPVAATENARQLVVADFNGDGRPDIFAADTGDDNPPFPGYQNTLILSAPDGKLVDATANLPQASDFTHSAAAGDVNGDGFVDIYEGNLGGGSMPAPRLLLNDGTGHFTVADGLLPAELAGTNPTVRYTGSALVDANGDGKLDLVLGADTNTPDSAVLLNDGTGHFSFLSGALPPKPFGNDAIGLGPTPLDINGDGHPDLIIGYTKGNPFYSGRWIQLLVGNGDGQFRDETAARLPQSDNSDPWPIFTMPRDLNRDGRTDFGILANFGEPPIYLEDSQGAFQPLPAPPVSFAGNQGPFWGFIDAEGDGSNDIISEVSRNGNDGTVYFQRDLHGQPASGGSPQSTGGGDAGADTTAPFISSLSIMPSTFRVARSGPSIARSHIGAQLYYIDSEAATTTLSVDRVLPGIKRGHTCVKPHAGWRRATRCSRFAPLPGSFSHADSRGPNHFKFTGRLGDRALPPGSYRLGAIPKDAAGNAGVAVRARFRIVRR